MFWNAENIDMQHRNIHAGYCWWIKFLLKVISYDDVIKWKHFPRYWPFVRGIHRPPVNSPHKGQWRGALMFSLICAWYEYSDRALKKFSVESYKTKFMSTKVQNNGMVPLSSHNLFKFFREQRVGTNSIGLFESATEILAGENLWW